MDFAPVKQTNSRSVSTTERYRLYSKQFQLQTDFDHFFVHNFLKCPCVYVLVHLGSSRRYQTICAGENSLIRRHDKYTRDDVSQFATQFESEFQTRKCASLSEIQRTFRTTVLSPGALDHGEINSIIDNSGFTPT